jgi:S-adenosylmethionine synthetase
MGPAAKDPFREGQPVPRQNYLFTSESVSEGHPDKVCDRISDEIVDLVYREARKSGMNAWDVRVACETLATTNRVVIAGEVRVPDTLLKKGKDGKPLKDAQGHPVINPSKFRSVARKAIRDIGYEQSGFHWKTAKIDVLLHAQSADIAQGVDKAQDANTEGAGDQGIMFGYACTETPDLMPAPIYYSHKILELLSKARRAGVGDVGKLGPDAKSQVTVKYVNGKPAAVTQIVLSTQHLDSSWDSRKVRKVVEPFIREALGDLEIAKDCNWYINPTGKFVIGGPDDRSAAYAARYLAKNVVAAKLAGRCTIQLAYAIGVAQPLSIYVDLHGTGKVDEAALEKALREVMDLSPSGIRRHLDLNKPIYAKTTAYGHFGRKPGRDGSFSWEKTDLVKPIKQALAA